MECQVLRVSIVTNLLLVLSTTYHLLLMYDTFIKGVYFVAHASGKNIYDPDAVCMKPPRDDDETERGMDGRIHMD